MSALRSARPVPVSAVPSWEAEADVVVVGYGVAGASAAVAAASAGADVLVLERSSGWGGAAAMAGGFIYLGGGTAIQRACGFEDTADDMHAFLTALMGPGADAAKLAAYSEGSVEHFDWLVGCGVPFRPAFFDRHAWEPSSDEGLMYSGGENAYPFADLVRPAPRGHLPRMADKRTGERGGGYMLMRPLVATATRLGCRSLMDARFECLVIGDDGTVSGVVATHFGQTWRVRARRGVVLASGGHAFQASLLAQHTPGLAGTPGSATEHHDGQGLRAAQAIGADVAQLGQFEVGMAVDPGAVVRGVLVDDRGHRFVNEDTYPGRVAQLCRSTRGDRAFLVIDERGVDEAAADREGRAGQRRPEPVCVSHDVAELERAVALPPGTLRDTLARYNDNARDGLDPEHHKAVRWLRPLEPPYGIVNLSGLTAGFPLGGLRTDVDARVLDVDCLPIPGLYAAGRVSHGIGSGGYASGCSLGDSSFFGRRAGRSAARGRAQT